jgi:hypothetical protein
MRDELCSIYEHGVGRFVAALWANSRASNVGPIVKNNQASALDLPIAHSVRRALRNTHMRAT